MTKRFCDRCGKPAIEIPTPVLSSGPKLTETTEETSAYVTSVDFIWDKKSSPAYRPDLCADCMIKLLQSFIAKLKPQ